MITQNLFRFGPRWVHVLRADRLEIHRYKPGPLSTASACFPYNLNGYHMFRWNEFTFGLYLRNVYCHEKCLIFFGGLSCFVLQKNGE